MLTSVSIENMMIAVSSVVDDVTLHDFISTKIIIIFLILVHLMWSFLFHLYYPRNPIMNWIFVTLVNRNSVLLTIK
jgi:hypothetical protein